jgi:hypothetical protein
MSLECQLHEGCALDWVVAIGLDLDKPQRRIQGPCLYHGYQSVQTHTGVAEAAGRSPICCTPLLGFTVRTHDS